MKKVWWKNDVHPVRIYRTPIAVASVLAFLILFVAAIFLPLMYESITQDVLAASIQPREYFFKLAEEKDLNVELLDRIVYCESKWRMVPNKKSSAYGYFQILDRTEKFTPQYKEGKSKYDAFANIEMGVYLFERYGVQPWNESRKCWGYLY